MLYNYVIIHHTDILSDLERLNLDRIYKNIKVDIFFILPKKFIESDLIKLYQNIRFVFVDDIHLSSLKNYNKYLIDIKFYELFINYEYILLYQLDTWQINFEIDRFFDMKFDFIGAPFVSEDRHKPIKFVNGRNGGVSIRNIKSCISILQSKPKFFTLRTIYRQLGYGDLNKSKSKYFVKFIIGRFIFYLTNRRLWPWHINEDIFWTIVVPSRFEWFKISDLETSLEFCVDQEPVYCLQYSKKTPCIVHAIEKYDFDFWKQQIKELKG